VDRAKGWKIVEAAQFGVPTVANDIDGLRASCPDPRLLAEDLKPETVAAKIREIAALKDEPALAQRLEDHWRDHGVEGYVSQLEMLYRAYE